MFDGRVDGARIAFTVRHDNRSVRYEGQVRGDSIVGTIPYRWEATRGS